MCAEYLYQWSIVHKGTFWLDDNLVNMAEQAVRVMQIRVWDIL